MRLRAAPAAVELVADGNRLEREGRLAEACALYRRAIEADPSHAAAHLNLGAALEASGDPGAAGDAYRALLERDPGNPYANYNLANLALARGATQTAEELLRKALGAKPDFPEAHVALANMLDSHPEEAAGHLRRALEQRPGYAGAWYNYGLVQRRLEQPDAAQDALRRALELDPAYLPAYQVLAAILRGEARTDEALQLYAAARRHAPQAFDLESAELFTLLFSDAVSEAELFARHRAFGERLERDAPQAVFHKNSKDGERRLRIGYVSPDFYRHPVALFMLPVLARHDRSGFEIRCYSTGTSADSVTAELRGLADGWREAAAMSDEELAGAIRADGVDILVDLAGHAGDSRLGVFARRPAPVQVTWLGYLHTTGTRCIQYRLCDRHTDPAPESEKLHTEKLVRLPYSQWCYRPFLTIAHAPAPPCLANGYVTFGSFNHPSKISPATRRRWNELLAREPDSRLVVVGVPPGRTTESLQRDLAAGGVGESRIRIVPRVPLDEYFRWFDSVDIALDTSPYSGGTTTCDALWMGVPVITAPGSRSVSRSAASLLTTLGLGDWIAPAPERYAALAAEKARDVAGLAKLRATLREQMRASPLMDEAGFTRDLENAYRRMLQ